MPQLRTGQYTFDAAKYAASPLHFDGVLARARQAGETVHCLCRADDPRPMVIRQIRGHHYLAVWPLGGQSHASWCPFHRNAAAEARLQEQNARVGISDGSAFTDEAPSALPMRESAPLTAPQASPEPLPAPGPSPLDPVVLPSLLGQIWQLGGLQRWMPEWSRDWSRVRRAVLATARRLHVHGIPLDDILLIPRGEPAARVADGWSDRVATLQATGDRRLLLAVVRATMETRFGWRLALEGVPVPVFVPARSRESLIVACVEACGAAGREGTAVPAAPSPSGPAQPPRLLALLDIKATPAGNVTCVDGHLQPASNCFFLCERSSDAWLADHMAGLDRGFVKRLPPAAMPGEPPETADFVLVDTCDDRGVAMMLVGPDSPVSRAAVAELLLERSLRQLLSWSWDTDQPCPELPCPARGAPL